MRGAPEHHRVSPWTLLRIWTSIGLQSFGGGASTQLLIWREFTEKRTWLDAAEMARFWSLCLFTPGINLIALTVLIGRKLGGPRGIVASLAGMLLPSATVTCLLAAGFEAVRHSPIVHAVLHGIIPATAGIMAVVGYNFARPIVARERKEGLQPLSISVAIMAASAFMLIAFKLSVVAVLAAVGLVGCLALRPRRPAQAPRPVVTPPPRDRPA